MLKFLKNIEVLLSDTTVEELAVAIKKHPWLVPGKALDMYDKLNNLPKNSIGKARKAKNAAALLALAQEDLDGVIDAINALALKRSMKLAITKNIVQSMRFALDIANGIKPSNKVLQGTKTAIDFISNQIDPF